MKTDFWAEFYCCFKINMSFPIIQIAEKEKEFSFLHSHVNSLSCDLNSLQSQVDTASILQKEKWKEFSNILTANRASMS